MTDPLSPNVCPCGRKGYVYYTGPNKPQTAIIRYRKCKGCGRRWASEETGRRPIGRKV